MAYLVDRRGFAPSRFFFDKNQFGSGYFLVFVVSLVGGNIFIRDSSNTLYLFMDIFLHSNVYNKTKSFFV
jgi:hypothetical protein